MKWPKLRLIPAEGLRWRGLSLQLFVVTVLPLTVLLLVVAFGSVSLHQGAMRSLVGERDQRAVRTSAFALNEQIRHRASMLTELALRATGASQADMILNTTPELTNDFDLGVAFYDRSGKLLAATSEAKWAEPKEAVLADWLSGIVVSADVQAVFSAPMVDANSGNIILLAAAGSPGRPVAVGAFSPAAMTRSVLAGAFGASTGSNIFLVDASGTVLYAAGSLTSDDVNVLWEGAAQALRGDHGASFIQTATGEQVLTYSPVPSVGWALVVAEPWKNVASPFLSRTLVGPLVLAPILVLALIALWFGARQIVRPLQALENKAAALAWGQFDPIEASVGGIGEIRRLQAELIHLAHKVKLAQSNLRTYIGAITVGQEEERKRLARELHDDTLQSLIALNQRIQLTQMEAHESGLVAALQELQSLTVQSIADLRRFVRALRPIYLDDLGLATALAMLAKETSQATDLQVYYEQKGPERRLPPTTELALYRIAQEALNNVVRHARAREAHIRMHFQPDALTMTISDEGDGFEVPDNPAEFARQGHFGLLGLQERAELIGAQLLLDSQPGRGSSVTVIAPLPAGD
ncbi:MAG: hypothetical protein GXP37_11055 [Chloroflexi bacterium]|nr:hypothetical protein [Chloroflexota bacterium]